MLVVLAPGRLGSIVQILRLRVAASARASKNWRNGSGWRKMPVQAIKAVVQGQVGELATISVVCTTILVSLAVIFNLFARRY
jgi:hypothetical protein